MTEPEQDILDRLDVLVEAAMCNDNDYVIQALEQYDNFMRTRVPNSRGKFEEKFAIKGKPREQENLKNCSVVLTPLPQYILEKYSPKKETNSDQSEGKQQQ